MKDEREQKVEPGIAHADYKRFAAAFATPQRFDEYIKEKKLQGEPGVAGLRRAFVSKSGIEGVIEPVYPFTKLDAKILIDQPKGASNNVIGLHIQYSADSAPEAQRMVGLLGAYAMDTIVHLIYSDAVLFRSNEVQARMTAIDAEVVEEKMRLAEHRRVAEQLARVVATQPSTEAVRQVVQVTDETARYLPPSTLLATARVQEIDANEAIVKLGLERREQELLLEYYQRVKAVLEGTKSGQTLLMRLEDVQREVFKDKDMSDEVVQGVVYRLSAEKQNAVNVYLNKSRYIAGPTLPERTTARPALSLAVGMALGFLLAVFLVVVRNWWAENKGSLS